MKKLLIAAACVLAVGLTSCGDTNYCYEVTETYELLGSHSYTHLWWGTKNDLKTYEQTLKDAAVKIGADEKSINISSKRTSKSQSDCHE